MPRKPDRLTDTDTPLALQLLHCLLADDLDRAIRIGLMDYVASADDDTLESAYPDLSQHLLRAQARLRHAWQARERHRARALRLTERAAARQARRQPAPAPESPPAALPPLAAAILARAKARAADKGRR